MKRTVLFLITAALMIYAASLQAQECGLFSVQYDAFIVRDGEEPELYTNGQTLLEVNRSTGIATWKFADKKAQRFKVIYQDKNRLRGTWVVLAKRGDDTMELHYRSSGALIGGVIIRKKYDPQRGIYLFNRTEFNRV